MVEQSNKALKRVKEKKKREQREKIGFHSKYR